MPGGCIEICEAEGAEFVPLFHTLLGVLEHDREDVLRVEIDRDEVAR